MAVGDRPWAGQVLAYLRENGWRLVVDLVVVAAWIVFGTELLRVFQLPTWFVYVVLFLGVVAYVNVTPNWELPATDEDGA